MEIKTQHSTLAMAKCDNYKAACDSLLLQSEELMDKNRSLQAKLVKLQAILTKQLDTLKATVKMQDKLIQQLKHERDQERSHAIRLQKELDELKAKHTASLAQKIVKVCVPHTKLAPALYDKLRLAARRKYYKLFPLLIST